MLPAVLFFTKESAVIFANHAYVFKCISILALKDENFIFLNELSFQSCVHGYEALTKTLHLEYFFNISL